MEEINDELYYYNYDGVLFFCDKEIPTQEIIAYIMRGRRKYGKYLSQIEAEIVGDDQEDVILRYKLNDPPKFDRIRRITGYLVGTTERFNDAKRAEERDRVKHKVE